MLANIFKVLAVFCVVSFPLNIEADELKREIPNAIWEPIFFKSINELAAKADWKSLREAPLPSGSLEVRVWVGFGLSPLQGYSLRRDGSRWTGHYVVDDFQQTNSVTVHDIMPKSDWSKVWIRLVQLDLLTLPDSSTLRGEKSMLDGVSYVVEINQGGSYRTYQYGNPQEQEWPEAKKILNIVQILHDEVKK
jgi:hypothetical protein